MIHPRYETAFRSLSSEEVHVAIEGLSRTRPELHSLSDFETGDELLSYCRQEHISQAEIIMGLSKDTRPIAVVTVEKLIMRPIDRRSPAEVERERDAARPRPAPVAPVRASEATTDVRIIRILSAGNPKRRGTKAWERFNLYRDGGTIADFLKAGGTRTDLTWDQEHGFIRVDPAA